jgi:trimeric autotransporter adhesin
MITKYARMVRINFIAGLVTLVACSSASNVSPSGNSLCQHDQAIECNTINGYSGNTAAGGIIGATIAGGGQPGSNNLVNGDHGTVGGGFGNIAGEGSTISGGVGNTAIYFHATVGGGTDNVANSEEATISGGLMNKAGGRFAFVGGGVVNIASADNSTVTGGSGNRSIYQFTSIGGGTLNLADNVAAVVAGGNHNHAGGPYSTVPGGINNSALGNSSSIGGGAGNVAAGSYAAIPGGFSNQADGAFSFAAGRSAVVSADHPGSFLFADSNPYPFLSISPDEFAVRATGGLRFVTAITSTGATQAGVRLSPGSGSWDTLSDASAKAGFAKIDGGQILARLATLPISTWRYLGQDPTIRHIGPTAQDFRSAFNLGQDGQYISTVDEEGIALASIQALYGLVQANEIGNNGMNPTEVSQQRQIASLESRLTFSNGITIAGLFIAILALFRQKGGFRHLVALPWKK